MIFDEIDIPWIDRQGKKSNKKLCFLGLSTCAFCKSALKFLQENDFAFKYILVDEHPAVLKQAIRTEFVSRFGKNLSYPTLIINGDDLLQGFIRPSWEKNLLDT